MIEKVLAHKKEIDADLERLSATWHKEWSQDYTTHSVEVLDVLLGLLNRGGKRLRGALAMESYYLHGGTRQRIALGAARVIELVQASLLTIDDIADNSETRRGGPSVHTALAELHKTKGLRGDSYHYGISQATNAAVLANHYALIELMALPAPDTAKVRAAELLSQDISVTIVGQINDLFNEVVTEHVPHDVIINTLTWKTAYYTFVSPLELGACLAGSDGLSDRLRRYALNAGVAFQISDDVLGTFGNGFEVGKSADDDIREGKATLLVSHAAKHASAEQARILDAVLGNPSAKKSECDKVRDIFESTGARYYATETAEKYAELAIAALGKQPESFLVELARFAVSRTS